MKLGKVLIVLKALVKPVSSLIKALEDGRISEEERELILIEFGLAVAEIVNGVVGKK